MDGQMNGERCAAGGKRFETFALRHARSATWHPCQDHALRDAGYGQLATQSGGGGGKGRHAGRERVGNSMTLEAAQLLGKRAVDRQVPRMKSCHIETRRKGGDILALELIERHRGAINQPRAVRTMREQFRRDQGAGVEADRTTSEEVAPTNGNQIRSAGSCANEVNCHCRSSPSASAQVTGPTATRAASRRELGPAAASAAASATDWTLSVSIERTERVTLRKSAFSSAS